MEERWVLFTFGLFVALMVAASAGRRTNRVKYLTAYACEGNQLHIYCEEGYLIHLIRANYGRYSIGICNEHGALDWSVSCASRRSYHVMYESCAMKNSCSIPAASAVFDDPCPGTIKYLEAHYNCLPESMTTTTTISTTTTTTTTSTRPPIIVPLIRFSHITPEKSSLTSVLESTTTISPTRDWLVTAIADQAMKASGTVPQFTIPAPTSAVKEYFVPVELFSTESVTSLHGTHKLDLTTKANVLMSDEYCQPVFFRNLTWDLTKAGSVAVQKCPGATVGEAKWHCSRSPARWVPENPDLSQCSSFWVDNLRTRVDKGDSVVNIASELAVVTHRKPLYGGDIRHATEIVQLLITKMSHKMQDIPDDKQRHQVLKELLESVVDVANNLLELSQKPSWEDLPHSERRHVASVLIESLEHSGWLLALGQRGPYYFRSAQNHVLFSVRVVEDWAISEVKFPSQEDINGTVWSDLEDSVHLPNQALLGTASNGVVKMVFAAFNKVEDFLGSLSSSHRRSIQNTSFIVNSRVIAASTGRYPVVKLAEPVRVTFRLVQQENVTNPQCVYWDLDARLWSVEGCWLRKANVTHAICACDHLTNFALLMEVKPVEVKKQDPLLLRIAMFVGCAISVILFILTAVLLQVFRNFQSNDYSTIHKNLCVCLLLSEAFFVAGIEQSSVLPIICALLAGALHLFLQAVFIWLFLTAFQLYILLRGPPHSTQSRACCYYLLAYGLAALIVFITSIMNMKSYGTSDYCFLRFDNVYILTFVGPAIFCILGAVVLLALTICHSCWFFKKPSSRHKEPFDGYSLRIHSIESFLVLLTSAGTWASLLLFWYQRSSAVGYLFTFMNCLMCFTVFICFGLRNAEVRHAYKKWQERCGRQEHPKNESCPDGHFNHPAACASSQCIMDASCVHPPTTVSSLSTVTSPELEFTCRPPTSNHQFNNLNLYHTSLL